MSSSQVNFAHFLGIESLAGAIVFAVLYVFLLAFFVRKSFVHPTYVHYILTLFCSIRVAAFTIRAVLAGSESAGETLGLVIADEVLSSVGYFSLLYSAYILVLDRTLLSDLPPVNNPILRVIQDRRVFRVVVLAAVVIGIVGITRTSSQNGATSPTTRSLKIASAAIFLVLTVLVGVQTIILARSEMSGAGRSQYYARGKDSTGIRYGSSILLIISILLIVREAFVMATVLTPAKQDNEHFWYPLDALPEIIVVILYTTPGLVPRADELPSYSPAETSAK